MNRFKRFQDSPWGNRFPCGEDEIQQMRIKMPKGLLLEGAAPAKGFKAGTLFHARIVTEKNEDLGSRLYDNLCICHADIHPFYNNFVHVNSETSEFHICYMWDAPEFPWVQNKVSKTPDPREVESDFVVIEKHNNLDEKTDENSKTTEIVSESPPPYVVQQPPLCESGLLK